MHVSFMFMFTARDCGSPPPLDNAVVELDANTTVNSTARYFCISEDSSRKREDLAQNEIQCLPNGTWSMLNFDCEFGKCYIQVF